MNKIINMEAIENQVKKLDKTSVYFIFFFLLLIPDLFMNIHFVNKLFIVSAVIIFLLACLLTLIKASYNHFLLATFGFFVWRTVSSGLINGGPLGITVTLRILAIILLINYGLENNPRAILVAISSLMEIYVILNCLALFIFPQGLYIDMGRTDYSRSAWIFGINNQFAYYLIPSTVLSGMASWYQHEKLTKRFYLIALLAMISIFKTGSATGIVSIVLVFLGILFVTQSSKWATKLSFYNLTLGYVILWLSLIYFNLIKLLQPLIVGVLNKSLTLSGRTLIWEKVIDTIKEAPLFGHGINATVFYNNRNFASHNFILQILLETGLVGLLLFLVPFVICGKRLQENKQSTISLLILVGIFGILFGGLSEAYRFTFIFIFLAFGYKVNRLTETSEISRNGQ